MDIIEVYNEVQRKPKFKRVNWAMKQPFDASPIEVSEAAESTQREFF